MKLPSEYKEVKFKVKDVAVLTWGISEEDHDKFAREAIEGLMENNETSS